MNIYACCKSSYFREGASALLISSGRLVKMTFCKELQERTVANLVLCFGGGGHDSAKVNDHLQNVRYSIENFKSERSQFAGSDPIALKQLRQIPNAVKKKMLEARLRRKVHTGLGRWGK